MNTEKVYLKIKSYYPLSYDKNLLPFLLETYFDVLKSRIINSDSSRIGGNYGRDRYEQLVKKYSLLPKNVSDPIKTSKKIVDDLFQGILRWRSPNMEYNVGAPVNSISSALYALALDENIYAIDDGLAGNALVAEQAVVKILSNLAGLSKTGVGFFTFGGTATNLYATKVGLKKAFPKSGEKGIPNSVRVFVTEDSHFSHALSADWLGIGTDNIISIRASKNRQSSIKDFSRKVEKALNAGQVISSIILNGGTTYDHTIDEIKKFVELRDFYVKKYSLQYKPHIHVDSVIGWAWLFFRQYDFSKNSLGLSKNTLDILREQCRRISQLKYADSWGADFHKGVGGCPVASSIVVFNNKKDLNCLSKGKSSLLDMHQLSREINYLSPADYTLETSRTAGAALSALAVLHFLGTEGYQRNLANLVELTLLMRDLLKDKSGIIVANPLSLGFSTMIRMFPPEFSSDDRMYSEFDSKSPNIEQFITQTNNYIKAFYKWDYSTRIVKNIGPSYSFSSTYRKINGVKVSAIKVYPVSPHFNKKYAKNTVQTLIRQKKIFDEDIWDNKK